MQREIGRKFLVLATIVLIGAAAAWAEGPGRDTGAGKDGAEPPRVQVDLNSASEAELLKVPGIGPALARRIVEFREQHGPFRSVEDVLKVRGIGEKSLEKLRPYLTVNDRKRK